jgi:transposase
MASRKERQKTGAEVRARKAQRRKNAAQAKAVSLPVIRPDTAGIDIGAMEIFAAVSPDRDAEAVRSFGSFTADLEKLIE